MKSNQKNDTYWLRHVCRLATRGLGLSSPNPSVGACIVKDQQCIGEGVHVSCGEAHAERLALADAQRQLHDVRGATIYVSLAPCTRHGKTPPCCDAIIESGIKRVVVAMDDPFQDDPKKILAQHGIEYCSNQFVSGAQHIHGGFLKRMATGLPRVTGKWAMTIDGYIATMNKHSQWISSPQALSLSRRRRRVFDAIVVGAETLRQDNPQLLAKGISGKDQFRSPLRVIIARSIPVFNDKRLLESIDTSGVLCFHQDEESSRAQTAKQLGIELQTYVDLSDIMRQLAQRGCNEVLVEGGSQIHHLCLDQKMYDRLEVYIGPQSIAGGQAVAGLRGADRIDLGTSWVLEQDPLRVEQSIVLRYQRQI